MSNLTEKNKPGTNALVHFLSKEYFSYTDLFISLINIGKSLLNSDFGIICSRQDDSINFLYATDNPYFKSNSIISSSDFNNCNIFLPQNETITAETRIPPLEINEQTPDLNNKFFYISTPVFLFNKVFAYILFFKSGGLFVENDYVIISNISMFMGSQIDRLTSFQKFREVKNKLFINEKKYKSNENIFLILHSAENKRNLYLDNNIFEYLGFKMSDYENDFNSGLIKIMHPEDVHIFRDRIEKLAAHKRENIFECKYRLKDSTGNWRFFYQRDIVYYYDKTGKNIDFLGIINEFEVDIAVNDAGNLTKFIKTNITNLNTNEMNYDVNDLLDFNIVQNLKELGGEEDSGFLKEVIELYIEQAPGLINSIKDSCSNRNSLKLSQSAHALKGASLNIGAKKFADICKQLEFKGKENDFTDVDNILKDFDEYYIVTTAELKKLY